MIYEENRGEDFKKGFLLVRYKYAWRAKFSNILKDGIEMFLKCLLELLFQSPELPFLKCSLIIILVFGISSRVLKLKSQLILEPHLIELVVSFQLCLSNKWLDMTSCSHQKIFVASLKSIGNRAEKKKIERGKFVFFSFCQIQ